MKKINIILASVSVLLALSLASCSDNGGQAENTPAVTDAAAGNSNDEVSEEVSEEAVPHEKVYEHTEDFFGRLDDDSKRQVELIASKIPELKGESSYIFVSDLDGNGRSELILTDPGFRIYEVSEGRDSLAQTVNKDSDYPSLYPVTDKLMCTDENGKRHYIWRSVKEEEQNTIRESEKEYIYENGTLTERMLRSRLYEKFSSVYTAYYNSSGESDRAGYARAVSDLMFRNGYKLTQSSIGVLTAGDIVNTDSESLKQLIAELKGFFKVTDPKGKYQYTDLEGKWIRTGGFSAGNNYFQASDNSGLALVISSDSYQLTGSLQSDTSPLCFCLGGTTTTSMWYASLTENNIVKDASVRLENDGKLILEGTVLNSDGAAVNAEWSFMREGSPELEKQLSTMQNNTETNPENVQNAPVKTPEDGLNIQEAAPETVQNEQSENPESAQNEEEQAVTDGFLW
ncbi:MAG: hypothetical protein IKN85_10800 [Oscillospiraceae bacterium]|nr:hypothetical protein [Oscillospiraceae bacterium]